MHWEILENSRFVITRYRAATAAQGYQGDTVANSMGDILSCGPVGFWLASRFRWWKSLVLLLAVELVLLFWIRDSLLLNVVMLICPVNADPRVANRRVRTCQDEVQQPAGHAIDGPRPSG